MAFMVRRQETGGLKSITYRQETVGPSISDVSINIIILRIQVLIKPQNTKF